MPHQRARRPLRELSNFALTAAGQAHTIAAPGVCILSTWLGGGYNTISGTSMASPHAAGSVALCLGDGSTPGPCAGLTPAQIIQRMRSDAAAHTGAVASYGFTGDPTRPVSGRYYGSLVWDGTGASAPPPPPPPPAATTASPTATTVLAGTFKSGGAADLAAVDGRYYELNSTTTGTIATDWYASFAGVPAAPTSLDVTYQAKNGRTCTQTLSLYRFTDDTWVTIDTRNVTTSEQSITAAATGALSAYVGPSGAVRARARCTTTTGGFSTSANLLQVAYTT